jgi:predicted outer membrane repeat protein
VKNCNDSGTDSLRDIIENPSKAKSGDKVDLGQLTAVCGLTDSKITLTGGEILVGQNDLELDGPPQGSVTISGGNASRVFNHQGTGTFELNSLRVSDGRYMLYGVPGDGYGGCINSEGSLYLLRTSVTSCRAYTNTGTGGGGAIRAPNVKLVLSTISGASEGAQGHISCGGGIKATSLTVKYSSISGNYANRGGGACADDMVIVNSTFTSNRATGGGALYSSGKMLIRNSTLSANSATGGSAIEGFPVSDITISNSTIAFNHDDLAGSSAVYFFGLTSSSALTLYSSIIANNTAGDMNAPADVGIVTGHGALQGADNLVIASNVTNPAVITATTDPLLGPLRNNGGPTKTHQLMHGSPAIAIGNIVSLPPAISTDQRGIGYRRTTGVNATADLGAVEFDSIFADGLESSF